MVGIVLLWEWRAKKGCPVTGSMQPNDHMVQWRLGRGIMQQMQEVLKGLKEIVPTAYLQPFDAQELEWVIAAHTVAYTRK